MSFYDQHHKGIEPAVQHPAYAVQDGTGTWRAQDTWPDAHAAATLPPGGSSYVDDGRADGADSGSSIITRSEPLVRAIRVTGTPRVWPSIEAYGNVMVQLHGVAPDRTAVLLDEQVARLQGVGQPSTSGVPTPRWPPVTCWPSRSAPSRRRPPSSIPRSARAGTGPPRHHARRSRSPTRNSSSSWTTRSTTPSHKAAVRGTWTSTWPRGRATWTPARCRSAFPRPPAARARTGARPGPRSPARPTARPVAGRGCGPHPLDARRHPLGCSLRRRATTRSSLRRAAPGRGSSGPHQPRPPSRSAAARSGRPRPSPAAGRRSCAGPAPGSGR